MDMCLYLYIENNNLEWNDHQMGPKKDPFDCHLISWKPRAIRLGSIIRFRRPAEGPGWRSEGPHSF